MGKSRSSTADYPIRAERIVEAQPRPIHYAFNELVAIVDDSGMDTGESARFVGLEIDLFGNYTGKAHISIVGGGNTMIEQKYLRAVKH